MSDDENKKRDPHWEKEAIQARMQKRRRQHQHKEIGDDQAVRFLLWLFVFFAVGLFMLLAFALFS